MTAAQLSMYFAEFGRLRVRMKAEGQTPTEIEACRKKITRDALGLDKSSKDFTNADFDAVLARIKALIDPTDLKSQLALQDSPDARRRAVEKRIKAALETVVTNGGKEFVELNRSRYIDGVTKKVCGGKFFDDLDDNERAKVMGALERSAAIKRRQREYAASAEGPNPF